MRLQKYLSTIAATMSLFVVTTTAAHAASAIDTGDFTVSATLTSHCRLQPGGEGQTMTFTYDAFQTSPASGSAVNFTFDCTRGLAPSGVAFDTTNGSAAGVGVVAGLAYQLTATAGTVTVGAAPTLTVGAGATTRAYAITGSMAAGQAGDSGAATSHTRTLIISY